MSDTTANVAEVQDETTAPEASVESAAEPESKTESAGGVSGAEKSAVQEDVEKESSTRADTPENDDDEDEGEESQASGDVKRLLDKNRQTNRENKSLRQRLSATALELNQLKVAMELGLPAELAVRLRGESVEDMRKDAEALLPLLRGGVAFVPGALPDDGVRRGEFQAGKSNETTDLSEIGARIYDR